MGFDKLAKQFEERDTVLLGGSTDNEFSKLGWRREHKDLNKLGHWSFGDSTGSLVDQLGVRDKSEGVALRATFIVDPDNTIQHVSVNNLNDPAAARHRAHRRGCQRGGSGHRRRMRLSAL